MGAIVSDHQPRHCLLNRLFRRCSKKTSQLRVTDLWATISPETGEFPAQMASNAEKGSIWCRHHALNMLRWIHQNLPSRLLAHALVEVYHFTYLCFILPQRSAILPRHIMFHLALEITFGWNAPCQLYVLCLYQSKCCENVKKVNVYTQPHLSILRQNSSQQFMSSIPLFHLPPNVAFYPNVPCSILPPA